jgi:hypothetical protein
VGWWPSIFRPGRNSGLPSISAIYKDGTKTFRRARAPKPDFLWRQVPGRFEPRDALQAQPVDRDFQRQERRRPAHSLITVEFSLQQNRLPCRKLSHSHRTRRSRLSQRSPNCDRVGVGWRVSDVIGRTVRILTAQNSAEPSKLSPGSRSTGGDVARTGPSPRSMHWARLIIHFHQRLNSSAQSKVDRVRRTYREQLFRFLWRVKPWSNTGTAASAGTCRAQKYDCGRRRGSRGCRGRAGGGNDAVNSPDRVNRRRRGHSGQGARA